MLRPGHRRDETGENRIQTTAALARWKRMVAAGTSFAVAAVGLAATPASSFDAPDNTAPAQSDTRMLSGRSNTEFGTGLHVADVNGDGVEDLLVGQPTDDGNWIHIYLGDSVTPLTDTEFYGDDVAGSNPDIDAPDTTVQYLEGFGGHIATGDFDNDGTIDIVSSVDGDVDAGSGVDGIVAFTYPGPGEFTLGSGNPNPILTIFEPGPLDTPVTDIAVADFNGSPGDDIAVGYGVDGFVRIYDGADGAELVEITANGEGFGTSVAAGEILDGSDATLADLVVGAPQEDTPSRFDGGAVRIYADPILSGSTIVAGEEDSFYESFVDQSFLGSDVLLRDLIGGPDPDLVVSAPAAVGDSNDAIFLLEGPLASTGGGPFDIDLLASEIWDPTDAGVTIGTSLAAGDVNNDGRNDLAAAGLNNVHVRAGGDAGLGEQWEFDGDPGTAFGDAIAIASNQYLAIGAPGTTNVIGGTTRSSAGAVELFITTDSVSTDIAVDSLGNGDDQDTGDGICATASGACTLRAAITQANADGGGNIVFTLGPGAAPYVIDVPTSDPLPAIISPIAIDGFSQIDSGPGNSAFTPGDIVVGLRAVGTDNAAGLFLASAAEPSTIRGLAISGFPDSAIRVEANGATIEDNRLGVRTTDAASVANGVGITIESGSVNNTIRRNLISNNTNTGIDALGEANITQNRIGTSPDGTAARPNGLGINVAGNSSINQNLISGNNEWGIQFKEGLADVGTNRIGVSSDDQPLGNVSGGILVAPDGAVSVTGTIGAIEPDNGNEIAFNGGPGIAVVGDGGRVAIIGNAIGQNDGLGIDLGADGPTANDPGDTDDGPNELLNTPEIDSVVGLTNNTFDVELTIDVDAGSQYRIELYGSNACDASGFGEGVIQVGTVTTGLVAGTNNVTTNVELARFNGTTNLTATLSRVEGGTPEFTSEYSNCISILTGGDVTDLTLSVDQSITGPGVTSIPITDIPIEAILGATDETATEAAPLGAVPLGAVDLAQSPLGAVPLSAVPLGAVPLGAVPLGAVPLSAVPVDFPGGWPALLEGTSLEGQLPQVVTLDEFLAIAEASPEGSVLQSLPLGAVDLSATPLGAVSLAALALGTTPLSAVAPDICADAATQGIDCAEVGDTLIGLELAGYDLASAPLGAVPLGAVPLGAVPLGAVPLTAVPLSAVPLSAVPLGAVPLGAVPLGAVPLGAVQLGSTPLSAVPLGAVALAEIPLGAVPLGAVDLQGTPLGAVQLDEIVDGAAIGCALLEGSPDTCASLGLTDDATLFELAAALEAAGSSLAASPLGAVPLGAVPLGAVPLGAVPLGAVPLGAVPLGAVPLGAVDIQGTPLGAVPLGAVAFDGTTGCAILEGSALDCAALGVDDSTSLFELAVLLEARGSSLAASPLGAVPLTAVPLSAVVVDDGAGVTTLADLFGATSVAGAPTTLEDLPPDVLDELSLADVLLALVIASDYPWEEIDIVALGIQDFVPGATEVAYSIGFTGLGGGDVSFTVALPTAYRYRTGSSLLNGASITDPIVAESASGQTLTWFTSIADGPGQLDFDVSPGFALGTETSDVAATTAGGTTETSDQAPHTIEPFAEPATAQADVLQLGYLSAPAETDVYDIASPGDGFTTSVFLSHVSEDTDLVLYRPTNAPPLGGGSDVAEAPDNKVIEDDGFAQLGADRTEPESLDDVPVDPSRSLVEASAGRGIGDEEVADNRTDSTDDYSIQVNGFNGVTSDDPYILRVKFSPDQAIPICPARTTPATPNIGAGALPDGLETLLVFDQGRMQAIHGEAGAQQVLASAEALVAYLNDPTNGFGSAAILFTDDLTNYAAWDANPCDWRAADDIAKDIRVALADYAVANESLRYITILGDDEVIPFHRQVDATGYANEDTFAPEFEDDQNALFGTFSTRHILTDHPYGDPDPIPWLDRFLYLPEVAVGRLLESPAEISTAIDTFIAFDGSLDPASTALITGYDFLTDGANDTTVALAGNGFTNTTIISDTWTDDDVENAIFTGDQPTLQSVNAHYDYYRALPAAEQLAGEDTYTEATLFQVDDVQGFLDTGGDLDGNWLFTMGCHAGLSVSDVSVGASPQLDWAQLYGGNGGVLTGNTGYGYGDTVTVGLTEEIVVNLAGNLNGELTIGQAANKALQDYYGRAGLYGVYDEKALQQFTTYGLPMYRVPGNGPIEPDPEPPTTSDDPFTGEPSATVTVDPTVDASPSEKGTVYSVDGQTLEIHYRPIQPMTSIDVTVDGLLARGAIITDWTSIDIAEPDIAFARPVIDDGSREAEIEDESIIFPSTFTAVAGFERPSNEPGQRTEERQNLNLIVGQYNAESDTQRLFSDIEVEVFYVDPDGPLADDDVPLVIEKVQASVIETGGSDTVGFIVDLDDDAAAARVVVLYRSDLSTDWQITELQSGSPWSGGGAVPAGTTEVEYLVQVVKPSGLVSVSSSKGAFYRATPAPEVPTGDPTVDPVTVGLDGTLSNGWYTTDVTVTVAGTNGPFTATVDGVDVPLGPDGELTISEDGVHVVEITGTDGTTETFVVPIDQTSPVVSISVPAEIDQGAAATIDYECGDAGSGVASCVGSVPAGSAVDTSTPGTFTVSVTASDIAGNPITTVTATYDVVGTIAPTVALVVEPEIVALGSITTATVTTTGSIDPTTLVIDWGDGTSDVATAGTAVDHLYDEPGVYAVTASATSTSGAIVTSEPARAVVYDASGARIFGIGRFHSSAGSSSLDPDASGRATFAFSARYRSASSTEPIGALAFRFRNGDIRFTASDWAWLAANETSATAEGTGHLRGQDGNFRFTLEIEDGRYEWGSGWTPDQLRLVITDDDTDEVIYDSGLTTTSGFITIYAPRPWGWGWSYH